MSENITIKKTTVTIKRGNNCDNAVASLPQLLEENKKVRRLVLQNVRNLDLYRKNVANLILTCPQLRSIDLSCNFGDDDITPIAKALWTNSTLRKLDLSNNCLTTTSFNKVATALMKNTGLWDLYLDGQEFCSINLKTMAKMLEKNTTLRYLNLSDNDLELYGIKELSNALTINSTLQDLELNGTCLRDTDGKMLGEMLIVNKGLKNVSFKNNFLQNRGTTAIAKALRVNTTLESLNLSDNEMSWENVLIILESLCENQTLRSLNLLGNNFDDSDRFKHVGNVLRNNKTLQTLFLCDVISFTDVISLIDSEVQPIADALVFHPELCEFNVKGKGVIRVLLNANKKIPSLVRKQTKKYKKGSRSITAPLKSNALVFKDLPLEIVYRICAHLSSHSLLSLLRVNRETYYQCYKNHIFWQDLFYFYREWVPPPQLYHTIANIIDHEDIDFRKLYLKLIYATTHGVVVQSY